MMAMLLILFAVYAMSANTEIDKGPVSVPSSGGRGQILSNPRHAQDVELPTLDELQRGWATDYSSLSQVTKEEVEGLKTGDLDIEASHGTTKHPNEAPIVRDCIDRNGTMDGTVWKLGDYFMRTCDLGQHDLSTDPDDRWFGVQILGHKDGWFEVTAYVPKLTNRTKDAFINWLKGTGWKPW
jgi:hypothetical protein